MSRKTHGVLDVNDALGSTRLPEVKRFDPTLGGVLLFVRGKE
jgi:hypothetical protein